jgi:hypothetical protein
MRTTDYYRELADRLADNYSASGAEHASARCAMSYGLTT